MKTFSISKLLFMFVLYALSATTIQAEPAAFKVQISGHGKPMILIPGLASSGEVWDKTVEHFSTQYQCHVLMLAGFAGEPPIQAPLLASVEQQLLEYISSNKLDHPVLVGHSLGGFLALRLAADHPDSVGKLVIIDSLPALGATRNPAATAEQLRSYASQMREAILARDGTTATQRENISAMVTKPEDIDRVTEWGRQSDRETVANAMYDLMAADLRDDVARITSPTLVLGTWIAFKNFAPRAAIEQTFQVQYQKLPAVTIELTDNARHFIMYDDPVWMYARMDEFLKK